MMIHGLNVDFLHCVQREATFRAICDQFYRHSDIGLCSERLVANESRSEGRHFKELGKERSMSAVNWTPVTEKRNLKKVEDQLII